MTSYCYWHKARVTKFSVLQSFGPRLWPGRNTIGEHFSAASVSRLLPSLKPLPWQSLSAPALQSGAPLEATTQAARPLTIVDGFAKLDRLSPASLARALRASKVSLGLFRGGSIDFDFSNSFPISLNRPGFSSRAGGADGCGSICCGGD